MRVLHPQDNALAIRGRWQAGVVVGGPGIGIMGTGQNRVVVAIGIERVFDDVVTGDTDCMNKELNLRLKKFILGNFVLKRS